MELPPVNVSLTSAFVDRHNHPLDRAQRIRGPADLVVLDENPLTVDPGRLRSMPVHATMVAGEWTYRVS